MYSKFPFSMENIPRQKSFACLSLRFGSILSALIAIFFSIFALAKCIAAINMLPTHFTPDDVGAMTSYALVIGVTVIHTVTFSLSALMLVGVLREKPHQVKPWVVWTSFQLIVYLLLFVFFTTMNMINHFSDAGFVVYVVEFLNLLVRFYMLVLVASYYKQLEEEKYEGERLKNLVRNEAYYSAA